MPGGQRRWLELLFLERERRERGERKSFPESCFVASVFYSDFCFEIAFFFLRFKPLFSKFSPQKSFPCSSLPLCIYSRRSSPFCYPWRVAEGHRLPCPVTGLCSGDARSLVACSDGVSALFSAVMRNNLGGDGKKSIWSLNF